MDARPTREFSSYSPAELRELYETNPTDFHEQAADAIRQACIGKTETQTLRLRQMQWVIDGQLLKGKTPLQKLHDMERIFYDQLYGSDGFYLQVEFELHESCPGSQRG